MTQGGKKIVKLDEDALNRVRIVLRAWPGLARLQPTDRDDLIQEVLYVLLQQSREGFLLGHSRLDCSSHFDEVVRYAIGILRHKRALLFRRRLVELRRWEKYARSKAPNQTIEGLTEEERRDLLRQMISQLPEHDRRILELCYQGLKLKQVADKLGIKYATARQGFVRALDRVTSTYFGRRRRSRRNRTSDGRMR